MPDISRLAINLATMRERYSFTEAIEAVARHGIPAIAPWREQIAEVGIKAARRHIRDLGLKVTSLCRGGLFPSRDRSALEANLSENARALEEAVELEAPCLVLVPGGLPEGSKDLAGARQQVQDGFAWLAEKAKGSSTKLALEPLHPMSCSERAVVNTMAHALDICDTVGGPVGIACDVYHVWWDPTLEAQIARAGQSRLLAFHLSDWLRNTKHLLFDRGMMGDGVIDIPMIRKLVEAQGYSGFHEVEIFSQDNWWQRDIDEVLSTCIQRHCDCC